jgi:hypothetical protein
MSESVVNFHLTQKRPLHRTPQNLFDFRVTREFWWNQNVLRNHLLQHCQPRAIRFVSFALHLLHH